MPLIVTTIVILLVIIPSTNSLNQNAGTSIATGSVVAPRDAVVVPSGHASMSTVQHPSFITKIVPDTITVKRGSSLGVLVYLTYNYVPGFGAPDQITVNMYPLTHQYALLKSWANLPPEKLSDLMDAYDANGTAPPGLYDTAQLVSYQNSGPIVINRNETESTVMTITIPMSYPDEFLNKFTVIDTNQTISDSKLEGSSGGIMVTVVG